TPTTIVGFSSSYPGESDKIPFMFCVDITHYISPPAAGVNVEYNTSPNASNTIIDYGTVGPGSPPPVLPNSGVSFLTGTAYANGISQMEMLVDHFGKTLGMANNGLVGTTVEQGSALQAAIWHVMYGGVNLNLTAGQNNANVIYDYKQMDTYLQTHWTANTGFS